MTAADVAVGVEDRVPAVRSGATEGTGLARIDILIGPSLLAIAVAQRLILYFAALVSG